MTALFCVAVLAVALFAIGWATVHAAEVAERKNRDLQAVIFAEGFLNELNTEANRWQR